MPLRGSVRYSSWQEARQYGEFPCISWRGLSIFFDPNTTDHKFTEDDKVEFTVGFNYRGPRVVHSTPVSKQNNVVNSKPQHYVHTLPETQVDLHMHSNKVLQTKTKL